MAPFKKVSLHIVMIIAMVMLRLASHAQTYWINHAGGPTIDEGMYIAPDAAGNSYITGYFTTLANFGTLSVNSSGLDDVFLAKTDAAGLYQWVVKAGGAGSDRALSIATDAGGNSYITGYFYGTATFGSQSITSSGCTSFFLFALVRIPTPSGFVKNKRHPSVAGEC